MPAETNHAIGEEGARMAKRYLESTTHVNLPHTMYDNEAMCCLQRLDEQIKRYDLMGYFRTGNHRPVAVECKKLSVVGDQPADYVAFLANAYSITAREISVLGADSNREFMWVTWHPFAQTKWSKLCSGDEIRAALHAHPDALNGTTINEDLVHALVGRLWLVPLHNRVEELLLAPDELYKVLQVLERRH
jgi:hypothetical protein